MVADLVGESANEVGGIKVTTEGAERPRETVRVIPDRLTAGQQRGKDNPPLGKPLQPRQ
jgi:hypothetical protein